MHTLSAPKRRQHNLATDLVTDLSQRILMGSIAPGQKLPSESEIVREHGVSRTVVTDFDTLVAQISDLFPGEIGAAARLRTVRGIGADEEGHRQAGGLQPRPGLRQDAAVGIIDGDCDRTAGQVLARLQPVDDLTERQNARARGFQMLDMGLELIQPDIGRGELVFPEPVIHNHHGRTAAGIGRSGCRQRDGGSQGQKYPDQFPHCRRIAAPDR